MDLSPDDRAWLDQLGPVRFSYDAEFAPFESTGANGEFTGAAAAFLDAVSEALGISFELVPLSSWPESVAAIRSGAIDLLPCIGRNAERETFLDFAEAYLSFARVVVTRRDFDFTGLDTLDGSRIAVQRDSSHHGYLQSTSNLNPALYDYFRHALLAVAAGERDAAIGNLATVTHVMQNLSLANLKIAGRLGEETFTLHMGVRKGLERLVPLLNNALASISLEQRHQILDYWIPLPVEASPALALSREEREWLLINPRIRLGWDPNWAPVEFLGRDGHPQGFSVDLMKTIQKMLGIRFVYEPPRAWTETLRRLQQRDIDMVSCIGLVKEREDYLSVTDVYLTAPVVLYAKKQFPYIRHLGELRDLTIAAPADYAETKWLEQDHPELSLLPVATVKEGLQAVHAGAADVFIGSVMQGNYYLSSMKNWSLGIAGETGYDNVLRMGVRNDWPLFVAILNKAIQTIPEEEQTSFYRKWVWVDYLDRTDYGFVIRIAFTGALLLAIVVWWNRRLAREIRLRTEAERRATENYARLQASEQYREDLTQMIVHDMRSPISVMSGAVEMACADLRHDRTPLTETVQTLEMAQASVNEIARIVDALLDVSRMEAGKMPLRKEEGAMLDIATQVVNGFRIVAEWQGVRLAAEGDAVHGVFDHGLMQRVLSNLVSNAIKACASGDRVTVIVRARPDGIRVEVRDTGRGIDPKHHAAIFNLFEQAGDLNPAGQAASSGVGLAFCKLAIQQHGGTVGLMSEVAKGSTFWFEIPNDP